MNARLKTLLSSITGALLALAGVASALAAVLSEPRYQMLALKVAGGLTAIAALLGNAGSIFASQRGLDAAAHVEAITTGTETVRAIDKGETPPAVPLPPGGAGA